jgi:hypothetical protein
MLRLPVELCLAVFFYLDFYELLTARQVCRQWQQIILDSYLWPSSVHGIYFHEAFCIDKSSGVRITYPPWHEWSINWPHWVGRAGETLESDSQEICQVLQTFSKGRTKSLRLDLSTRVSDLQDILDVLHNSVFLEEVSVDIVSISSLVLTSVLQGLPQITSFILNTDEFHDTPTGRLNTRLNIRKLSIRVSSLSEPATLHNTVADVVEYSPDLVCLSVGGLRARDMWTRKIGDRIRHLSLYIERRLPHINCRGLKYLVFKGNYDYSHEHFEHSPCDLSYLTHLRVYGFSAEQQLSLMKSYNIGENLEFMHMDSNPGYAALARTPRLKSLGLKTLGIDMPLHVCPELRTIYIRFEETNRDQPQGYIVHSIYKANLSLCDVCHNGGHEYF